MKCSNKILKRSGLLLLLLCPLRLFAVAASGGDYELTKALVGASGVNQTNSRDYSASYSLGEDVSGTRSYGADYDLVTGYFSGYASGYPGHFSLVSATIGTTKIMQGGFQVGVPLSTTVQLAFSSPLDLSSIALGIQANLRMDHLGNPQDRVVPSTFTYSVAGTTVVFSVPGGWLGNTLYDIVANGSLRSIDGFVLAEPTHTPFITVLNPHEENVVLQPIPIVGSAPAPAATDGRSLHLHIPRDSLSDYAYVLVSQDPLNEPLQVNPAVLQQASQKAEASGGAYQSPLALQEIAAYNQEGRPMSLSKSITFSVGFSGGQGLLSNRGVPVHSETLSLWALDSAHALWVKMPDSRPNGSGVMGAVTQFSVYALMGTALGDASSTYVFPMPWRPHGPDAGAGAGQSGTDSGGITFSNLPSECDIKIYTVSGSLVRKLHHSDLTGPVAQEVWDGKTSGGDPAASGVYLWRVESTTDSKNGKLMVIR